jgi:hypothetical protein
MSGLVLESRDARRPSGRPEGRESLREVALLRRPASSPGWKAGECVAWAGRRYVVAAVSGGVEGGRHVHLRPAPRVEA